jgi:hypothetical protein
MNRPQAINVARHLRRTVNCSIVGLIFLIASASLIQAQSTEMDRPTPITLLEVSRTVDESVAHYYSFEAGPGEMSLLIASRRSERGAFTVHFELFDEKLNRVERDYLSSYGNEEQKILKFTLAKKQQLLLKISTEFALGATSGRYRIRLGGAVALGGSASLTCLPKQGTLRIKMKDGSVKEIDLKEVEETTVQP